MILLEWGGLSLDLSDCQNAWRVTSFDPGFPEVRNVDVLRPQADGITDETRFFGPRAITVQGILVDNLTPTIQAAMDQLAQFLNPSLRPTLTWQLDPAEQPRQAVVRVDDFSGVRQPAATQEWQISWVASDPYWYQLTEDSVTLSASGLGEGGRVYNLTFNRTYPEVVGGQGVGNAVVTGVATPPHIQIFGECTNPQVINQTTGQQLAITGTIAAGHYLDIDVGAHTVTLDGDPNADRYSMLDFVASDWWLLQPGTNVLRFTADDIPLGTAAHVVVSWRERSI